MNIKWLVATALSALLAAPLCQASPEQDLEEFQASFKKRFKDVSMAEFGNGVYAFDKEARTQWMQAEEFPPYEEAVDAGRELWESTTFANGKGYADCFEGDVASIRGQYPMWDASIKEVVTLEMAINTCRSENGDEPLEYGSGDMVNITGFLAMEARGTVVDIKVPASDPDAMEWYNLGKFAFYAKHGQLNMACADCHMAKAGLKTRSEKLSPALGHPTNWPTYRAKWEELGSLHRQFENCLEQVRAASQPYQSKEFRALEYFLTYMSNGTEWNGPSTRK